MMCVLNTFSRIRYMAVKHTFFHLEFTILYSNTISPDFDRNIIILLLNEYKHNTIIIYDGVVFVFIQLTLQFHIKINLLFKN